MHQLIVEIMSKVSQVIHRTDDVRRPAKGRDMASGLRQTTKPLSRYARFWLCL